MATATVPINPSTMLAASDIRIQTRPNTVMALKLRKQATTLKNRLLTGVMPCQCTSAGAYQNKREIGT